MEFLAHVLMLVAIFGTAAASLSILVHGTGYISIGHAIPMAIGAYTVALGTTQGSLSVGWLLILSLVFATASGLLLLGLSMRLREDKFALATLGCQVMVFEFLINVRAITNGPFGIQAIPTLVPRSPRWISVVVLLLVLSVGFAAAVAMHRSVVRGRLRKWTAALRSDENWALSVGVPIPAVKALVFLSMSGVCGLSGACYAFYIGYVDPTSFTVWSATLLLLMALIAGRSVAALGLGAAAVIGVSEALRLTPLPDAQSGHLRQVFIGACLIAIVLVRGHHSKPSAAYSNGSLPC